MVKCFLLFLYCLVVSPVFSQVREVSLESDTLPCAGDDGLNPGIVPGSVTARMGLSPDSSSWRKIDAYYRDVIMVRFKDCLFYDNARRMAISRLILTDRLLERSDLPTIEFYAEELFQVDYFDTKPLILLLTRLKGHWPDLKLFDIARKEYRDIQERISKLMNPEEALEKNKDKLRALQDFIESVDPH